MRRRSPLLLLAALAFLASGGANAGSLEDESERMVGGMFAEADVQGKRLAVGDFTDTRLRRVTALSGAISDGLEAALVHKAKSLGFTVVERRSVDALTKEGKLGDSGLATSDSAKKAGRLLGVDAFLVGNFTVTGTWVGVTTKLVESKTGEILRLGTFAFEDIRLPKSEESTSSPPGEATEADAPAFQTEEPSRHFQSPTPESYSWALGANYLGGQVRHNFSPAWAAELRYVTGWASSDLGAVTARAAGLRGYRFLAGKRLQLFLGGEAAYVVSTQKGTSYRVTGPAVGGFGGIHYPVSSRISLDIDIGPYLFSLKERNAAASTSSLEFVADSFINFYLF